MLDAQQPEQYHFVVTYHQQRSDVIRFFIQVQEQALRRARYLAPLNS